MVNKIRCISCRFTRQDMGASVYTQKRCKGCEMNEGCKCRKKACVCCNGCKFKGTDAVCPKQTLMWAAVECGNPDSEYHKALLNVTLGGEIQDRVTWSGCVCGERGVRL